MGIRRRLRHCGALLLVAVAAGCAGQNDEGGTGTPTVVATTSIGADIVANIACDDLVEVVALIPDGADPHAFEPSLADRGDLEQAALVVMNGLGLEEGLEDTIAAVQDAGTPVVAMTDHIDGADPSDPHVWFDPLLVAEAMPTLAEALVAEAGLDADTVGRCAADYREELVAVDAEIAEILDGLAPPERLLVTNHDALGYFAARYGFDVVGTVLPSSSGLAETNPAQLEELARRIEETGVAAIFTEEQHSAEEAEALARRIGDVQVVVLSTGSLGDGADGTDTYVGFLRTNAQRIADALT